MANKKSPQFGVSATDMGKSNHQGYIQQGIIDRSGATETAADFKFASQVGGLAIDTAKKYSEYEALKGVAGSVDDVIAEQKDRSLAGQQQMAEDIMAGQEAIATAQAGVGYDGTYPTMLNQQLTDETLGIQNSLAEKTSKLTQAREQGVMTELELSNRLAKITREAIANNPAYADKIIAHVGKVASINNITANVKADEKAVLDAQKQAQGAVDDLIKIATRSEFNIPVYSDAFQLPGGGFDVDAIQKELTIRQERKYKSDMYQMTKKDNEAIRAIDADKFLETGEYNEFNNAVFYGVTEKMNEIMSNQDMKPNEKARAIEMLAGQETADLKEAYRKAGASPTDPRVKEILEGFDNRVKAIQQLYQDSANGKLDSEALKNEVDILTNTELAGIIKKNPSIVKYQTMSKILNGMEWSPSAAQKQHQLVENVVGMLELDGEAVTPKSGRKANQELPSKINMIFKPEKNGSIASQASMTTLELHRNKPNDETRDLFLDEMEARVGYISNPKALHAKAEAAQLIKDLNNPMMVDGFQLFKSEPAILQGAQEAVDGYTELLKNAYQDYKKNNPDFALEEGVEGMAKVKGKGVFKHKAFASDTLKSINETYTAWKLLNGKGDDARDEFFSQIVN